MKSTDTNTDLSKEPEIKEKPADSGDSFHRIVSSIWGTKGWLAMHHAPCKNGKIWIVTDLRRDVWDLVKWSNEEWSSERGIEMSMTHCKPFSLS